MKHARADYDRIQDPAGLIPDDEPVFLLRGQDRLAAQTLEFYAKLAHREGVAGDLVSRTMTQAKLMREWPMKKTPDLPPAQERPL